MIDKVLCGDCIEKLDLIKPDTIHAVITSPPYNNNVNYDNYEDKLSKEDYFNFLANVFTKIYDKLVSGGRICVNIGEMNVTESRTPTQIILGSILLDIGYLYRGTVIWNKKHSSINTAWGSWKSCSNPSLIPRFEYVLIFSKDSMKLEGDPDKIDIKKHEFIEYTNPIWDIIGTHDKNHPAVFPEELVKRLIKLYTYQENIILDPFAGRGTTGIVAKKLNRNYILIEQSETYIKLIKKNLREQTAKKMF